MKFIDRKCYKYSCGIYKITNIINNKSYVGRTHNFTERYYSHKYSLRNNKHHNLIIQNSFNKYGEECFEFEVLVELKEYCRDTIVAIEQMYLNSGNYTFNISTDAKTSEKGILSKENCDEIIHLFVDKHIYQKKIAEILNISPNMINRILKGKCYSQYTLSNDDFYKVKFINLIHLKRNGSDTFLHDVDLFKSALWMRKNNYSTYLVLKILNINKTVYRTIFRNKNFIKYLSPELSGNYIKIHDELLNNYNIKNVETHYNIRCTYYQLYSNSLKIGKFLSYYDIASYIYGDVNKKLIGNISRALSKGYILTDKNYTIEAVNI